MAEKPINLRLRRKQKARDEKRVHSDRKTNIGGISKHDRAVGAKLTDLDAARLDGHQLKHSAKPDDDG